MRPIPEWRCWWLYQSKKLRPKARACSMLWKRSGNPGRYLSVLNCASESRVVGGGVGTRVALEHAEIGQEKGHGLAGHRTAAVGVHGQRARRDLLLFGGLGDQRLRDRGRLAMLNRPGDGVAAEDVEDHVEVEVRPLRGPEQLRDVPGPQLVGALGEQLGFRVGGMGELVAALAHLG